MKTALITTTINIPWVLRLYGAYGPEVEFFVAGDQKTPAGVEAFCKELGKCHYLSPAEQGAWSCSEAIGWNCIQRRNLALLEAIKWGAQDIVTIDDDNLPIEPAYFSYFRWALGGRFNGLCATSPTDWFDPGQLLVPKAPHRGFPIGIKPEHSLEPVTNVKIGVAAGLCLGDPDVSAVTRIATAPEVHGVAEVARSGICVSAKTWTVFNSQNTSFIRELAPAMFMPPGIGRMDDIYASLICQRVMRGLGYHVHFGQPFIHQTRNEHNLVNDLRQEIDGMDNILKLAKWLEQMDMPSGSVAQQVRIIYERMRTRLPDQSIKAALAFLDDYERVTA